MVLTRSDSATSVWVLPPPPPPHFDPLAPGPDGNYTLPDSRQLAQLCAVCVHNLALDPPLSSPPVGPAALDQDRRLLNWPGVPTSQFDFDRDRDVIRPLAGPSSSSASIGAYHGARRKRAASTATVAGEWAGAPAPTPDRILSPSSTALSPPPPPLPPAVRRSVSAGMISTRGNNNRSRSSTVTAAPPASSTIDEEQEATTSPPPPPDPVLFAAEASSAYARPSDSTIPTRIRSASRASSTGSTSTIREAPRIPLRPSSDVAGRTSAISPTASRQPQSTGSLPSQRRREKQKSRLPVSLVESFVSLELLPPLATPDAEGVPATETTTTTTKKPPTRSRSGSVRSVFGGVGGAAAPSMSRSGSTGSVHGTAVAASSSSSAIPSPRKRMRRRTISSAALFAPLPTLASLAGNNSSANESATTTAAAETDRAARANPFYVSDVADAATHATFFLDPENCVLPSDAATTTDSTAPRRDKEDSPKIAAFPEEIQDWPGWRQSRFKATLWGRREEEEEGAKNRDRLTRKGKQRQETPNPRATATPSSDGWRVLVEWEVDLAGLTSLGRDPTDFPELPPNTLVFALSTDGGVVPSFPSVDPSTSSSGGLSANLPASDHLEYLTAPILLLQRAYRRRLRAARRARIATTLQHQQQQQPYQQRSWSEDELSDYLDCCYDSDCSSCEEGDGRRSDADGEDDEEGVTGGHASDPGVVSQARTMAGMLGGGGGRKRSDTIRSRRAAAASGIGRRGTIVSLRNGGPKRTRYHHQTETQTAAAEEEEQQQLRRQARLRAAEEVLEKSRRETRMVRAAGWDEIRRLCEARWELGRGSREVQVAREAVERALGADETGWAAQERFRSELQDRLDDLEGVKEAVEAELSEEQHELDIRAALLRQRRQRLEKAKLLVTAQLEQLERNSTLLAGVSQEVADLANSTQTRQTQLITLLSHIFPIEPVPTAPRGVSPDLLFSILGIALPNSTFSSSYSDDLVSSALGYAAQVTQLLAAYLAVPMAYPITCRGSRSYLQGEISMMKGSRAFPLFAKGVERYRFDYAVFLLNKNIEQLMFSQSLTVLDLRNTLPNLMTLMLSLSYEPSHDDYLASTLLPTGPFADQPSSVAVDDVEDAPVASADDNEASSLVRANGAQGEERASTRTRSSRSGSNASTIRPSRRQDAEILVSDVGDPSTSSVPASDEAASLIEPPAPSEASTAVTPTSRKGRRLRRRSSSSASEKVTLVTTVQKAAAQQHGRSSSSGSTASSNGSGGGGIGYGAKLREGLWTVVAGSAGRRESSSPRDAAIPADDRSHAAPATTS